MDALGLGQAPQVDALRHVQELDGERLAFGVAVDAAPIVEPVMGNGRARVKSHRGSVDGGVVGDSAVEAHGVGVLPSAG